MANIYDGPPEQSPWGSVQHKTHLAPGVWFVGTASHGGIWVAPKLRSRIPAKAKNFLKSRTWWEEDCDWVIPYIVFYSEIHAHASEDKRKTVERNLASAVGILKQWHKELRPDELRPGCEAERIVYAIHEIMDGSEWDADILDKIWAVLIDAGYETRDPDECD